MISLYDLGASLDDIRYCNTVVDEWIKYDALIDLTCNDTTMAWAYKRLPPKSMLLAVMRD